MPEFFIFSLSEFFEVPLGGDFFRCVYNGSIFSDEGELYPVECLACSDIEDREALFEDFLALLIGFVGIPLISE